MENGVVVLINPVFSQVEQHSNNSNAKFINRLTADYPLAILYLSGYLEGAGFDTVLIDAERIGTAATLSLIDEYSDRAALFGLSVMTPAIPSALEITDYIKSVSPQPVFWGGVHPTLFPRETITDAGIDYIVTGEGEMALSFALDCMQHRDHQLIDSYPNILSHPNQFKGCRNSQANGSRRSVYMEKTEKHSLEAEPVPSFHKLDMERYINVRNSDGRLTRNIEIVSSRGCPYRCSFCLDSILNRGKWRSQSAAKVIDDLSSLINEYRIDHVFFLDEFFFVKRDRALDIVRGMKRFSVSWEANMRADFMGVPSRIPDSYISEMAESGCTMIHIGAESGSQRILNYLQKDIEVEQIVSAVKRCKSRGILCNMSFMIGLPVEERRDMELTIELIDRVKQIEPRTEVIGPQGYRPYPGSKIFDDMIAKTDIAVPSSVRDWQDSMLIQNMKYNNVITGSFDGRTRGYLEDRLGYIVCDGVANDFERIAMYGDRMGRRFQNSSAFQ